MQLEIKKTITRSILWRSCFSCYTIYCLAFMLCAVVNWDAWTPSCNLEIKKKNTIYCLAFMLFMLVNWAAWTPVLLAAECNQLQQTSSSKIGGGGARAARRLRIRRPRLAGGSRRVRLNSRVCRLQTSSPDPALPADPTRNAP